MSNGNRKDRKTLMGRCHHVNFTFDTADVVVEFLLQFIGSILLFVEILDVIVENLIGRPVYLAHLLQDLQKSNQLLK